jgi:hypothetical protein
MSTLTVTNLSGVSSITTSSNVATFGTGVYFLANGSVGIGNSSPTAKLDIAGRTNIAGFLLLGNYGGQFQGLTLQNSDNSGAGETINFIDSQNNLGTADSHMFFGHQTDGGSFITMSTTPPGSRTSDRRVERMRFDPNGSLLLNTTSTSYATAGNSMRWIGSIALMLSKASTADLNQIAFFNPNGLVGYINTSGTTTVYGTSSDYRLKNSVQSMDGGLATIAALKPSTYRWNADGSYGEGFIAHELAEHIPLAVSGEKDAVNEDGSIKPQGVDYSKIVVHLVSAVQELNKKLEEANSRIASLEGKN